jgi:hypothetical protein
MKNYIVLRIRDGQMYGASEIEDIICLSSLIAAGNLPPDADMQDVERYFNKIFQECSNCPLFKKCLACKINE